MDPPGSSSGRAFIEGVAFVDCLRQGPGNMQDRRSSFADKLPPLAQQPWQGSTRTTNLPTTPISPSQSTPQRHSAGALGIAEHSQRSTPRRPSKSAHGRMFGAPVQSVGETTGISEYPDLPRSKVSSARSDNTISTIATQTDFGSDTVSTCATLDDIAAEPPSPKSPKDRKERSSRVKTKAELDKEFQTVCVAACGRAAELDKEFETACGEMAPDILKHMKKLQGQWFRKNQDEKEQDARSTYLMQQRELLEDGARRVGCVYALTLALAASAKQGVVPETQSDSQNSEVVLKGRRASADACFAFSAGAERKVETVGSLPEIQVKSPPDSQAARSARRATQP